MRCSACNCKLKDNESYWHKDLHRYEDMCKPCRRYAYNNDEIPESSLVDEVIDILDIPQMNREDY